RRSIRTYWPNINSWARPCRMRLTWYAVSQSRCSSSWSSTRVSRLRPLRLRVQASSRAGSRRWYRDSASRRSAMGLVMANTHTFKSEWEEPQAAGSSGGRGFRREADQVHQDAQDPVGLADEVFQHVNREGLAIQTQKFPVGSVGDTAVDRL